MSLRLVRSPAAPKMTMMQGVFSCMDLKTESFSICHLRFFICHFNHRSRLEWGLVPTPAQRTSPLSKQISSNDRWKMIILSRAARDVRRTSGALPREFFRRTYVLAANEIGRRARRSILQPERLLRSPPESSSGLRLNLEHSRCNSRVQDLRAAPWPSARV